MFKNLSSEIGSLLKELFDKEETWFLVFVAGLTGILILPFIGLSAISRVIADFLALTWWLWLFLILFFPLRSLWLFWRQETFKKKREFVLLELKVPPLVEKSPQAMEQVLMELGSIRKPQNIKEKYWDGEIFAYFSLEIVSLGGQVHFFVRVLKDLRKVMEAVMLSYYPDMDIMEVEDYAPDLPGNAKELEKRNMDMWGSEMVLAREDAYPIKTYTRFESMAEEKQFDPMSGFLEVMGKLQDGEFLGVQILIEPADPDWKDKYTPLIDELKKKKAAGSIKEGEMADFSSLMRSPGETEVLKAVEMNLSKPAFLTLVRFMYVAPKPIFYKMIVRTGLTSAFNQFSALDMNSFKTNSKVNTSVDIWKRPGLSVIYAKTRLAEKMSRILHDYKLREIPPTTSMGNLISSYAFSKTTATKRFMMNVEGIATLFHMPTASVLTAPHIKKMESRKIGPPAGLAIFGEEGDIGKYK